MRQIEIQKQFLAAGASQVEEKKWAQLEKGAERQLKAKIVTDRRESTAAVEAMETDVANRYCLAYQ